MGGDPIAIKLAQIQTPWPATKKFLIEKHFAWPNPRRSAKQSRLRQLD